MIDQAIHQLPLVSINARPLHSPLEFGAVSLYIAYNEGCHCSQPVS